jgi:hypothetical protein
LVLPKYGGRKASNSEKKDTSAFAKASFLFLQGKFGKKLAQDNLFYFSISGFI